MYWLHWYNCSTCCWMWSQRECLWKGIIVTWASDWKLVSAASQQTACSKTKTTKPHTSVFPSYFFFFFASILLVWGPFSNSFLIFLENASNKTKQEKVGDKNFQVALSWGRVLCEGWFWCQGTKQPNTNQWAWPSIPLVFVFSSKKSKKKLRDWAFKVARAGHTLHM